jgi:AcrR family transcriptional regulator
VASSEHLTAAEKTRLRIGEAMVALVLAEGYEALGVESLCERAEVSEAEFEQLFEGLEEAYIWIHERNVARFEAHVLAAFNSRQDWREAMRAAAYAAARWIEENPERSASGSPRCSPPASSPRPCGNAS